MLDAQVKLAEFMEKNPDPTASKEGEMLVRTLMDKTKPAAEPALTAWTAAYENPAAQLAYLSGKLLTSAPSIAQAQKTADVVNTISTDAKRSAMQNVAIFPCVMAVCYLGLIIHFKRKGGYTAVELSAGGQLSTEYTPTPEQEIAHAEATPSE